jgi:branched-chain amino acid aminotransferase
MELAEKWGYKAEQRKVSIQELIDGIKAYATEAFAAGTAATITDISRIGFEGTRLPLATSRGPRVFKSCFELPQRLALWQSRRSIRWNYLVSNFQNEEKPFIITKRFYGLYVMHTLKRGLYLV